VFTTAYHHSIYCDLIHNEDATNQNSNESFKDRLRRSVRGSRFWVEPTGRPREAWKRQALLFLIYLVQLHRFTLICCKIHRCLNLHRKLALAEKKMWMCLQVFVHGVEFSFTQPLTRYWMNRKLLSFLYVSRSKQQSTHQCYILAVHDVTQCLCEETVALVSGPAPAATIATTIVAASKIARVRPA
jgi:hypothetical protein